MRYRRFILLLPIAVLLGSARAELVALHEGSQDPVSVEGWREGGGFPPGVVGEAIDDEGTPAWRIYDPVTVGPEGGGSYQFVPTVDQHARASAQGWTFSTTMRLIDHTPPVETSTVGITYRNGSESFQLAWGLNSGVIHVIWVQHTFPNTTGPRVALPHLDPAEYHTYDLIYNPDTRRSSLRVNGVEVMGDLSSTPFSQSLIAWGALSSTWTGQAHYSRTSFTIHDDDVLPPETIGEWVIRHQGAKDPHADEGWTKIGSHPNSFVGPVNDAGTFAWRTDDDTRDLPSSGALYHFTPSPEQNARAKAKGWTFSCTLRIVDQSVPVENASITTAYRNGSESYQLVWGINGGILNVMWAIDTFGSLIVGPKVSLPDLDPHGYHRYDLVYNPLNGRSSLRIDGVERMDNLVPAHLNQSLIGWGAGSSINIGEAYWSDVSFGIHAHNPPVPAGKFVALHQGSKDPVNEESWSTSGGSAAVITGPVTDNGTSAWRVDDNEGGPPYHGGGFYSVSPSTEQHAKAIAQGWTLSTSLRIVDTSVPVEHASMSAVYRNGSNYQLAFGVNNGELNVMWVTDTSGSLLIGPKVALPGLSVDAYHRYDLSCDPVNNRCRLQVDGVEVMSGLVPISAAGSLIGWGAGSSINTGEAYYSDVHFQIHNQTSPPRPKGDCIAEHHEDLDPLIDEEWEKTGGWLAGIVEGPVDDNGTNAWRLLDARGVGPQFTGGGSYFIAPTPEEHARAKANGWTFSTTMRLIDQTTPVEMATIGVVYRNGTENYQLAFGVENGEIHVLWVTHTFPLVTGTKVILAGLNPHAYHTYDLVHNPASGLASLWVDGTEYMSGLVPVPFEQSLIAWGGLSSVWTGEAYFSNVSFKIHKRNACIKFDGIDDVMRITPSAAFHLDAGFSIEAWVGPSRHTAERQVIVSRPRSVGGDVGLRLSYGTPSASGIFEALLSDGNTEVTVLSTPVDRGSWHHVAMTHDGALLSLYVDGELAGSVPAVFTPAVITGPIFVGGEIHSGNKVHLFRGCIDDLRIWSAPRTKEKISGGRYFQLHGDEADLAGYWSFDDGVADDGPLANGSEAEGDPALDHDEESERVEVAPLMEVRLPHTRVGNHYQLQYVDPSVSLDWQDSGPIVGGSGGPISLLDPQTTPCRWYRVVLASGPVDPNERAVVELNESVEISVQTASPFSQYRFQYATASDPTTWHHLSDLFHGNGTRVKVLDLPRKERRIYRVQRFSAHGLE